MIHFSRLIKEPLLIPYCFSALWHLSIAKIIIVFIPFKLWKKRCGIFQCESLKMEQNMATEEELKHIIRAIQGTAKHLPWQSKCLDKALAVQSMLKKRRLTNTLYLGMIKDENQQWLAHAWIRCGNHWVIGYQPNQNYTIVGTYAWIDQCQN